MTRDELASLSFAELRARFKARIDQVGYVNDIEWSDALSYLTSLPDHEQTEDSGNALIELGRNYSFSRATGRSFTSGNGRSTNRDSARESTIAVSRCGLSGESIAQEARLVAVCDAFDAMTHKRLWRKTPLSIQAALSKLRQKAGAHFDPLFVNTFTELFERKFSTCNDLDALLAEGSDEFEYARARARMEALIADR